MYFSNIHGFRHLLGNLDHLPHEYVKTTVVSSNGKQYPKNLDVPEKKKVRINVVKF
jgi:hypothetical protein